MSNDSNDFMYNWIQRHNGKGKVSGSSDNNPNTTYSNTHNIETQYCNIHNIKLNNDNLCSVCIEGRNV